MPEYQMPSWANWKKLAIEQLAAVDIDAAEQEMERVWKGNSALLRECIVQKEACIKLAVQIWGGNSNVVAYLKRTHIESPPNLRSLLTKYQRAVNNAKEKMTQRAKGRVAYQRRKRNKLVEAEVDQYVLDRYGAGWVEQEG